MNHLQNSCEESTLTSNRHSVGPRNREHKKKSLTELVRDFFGALGSEVLVTCVEALYATCSIHDALLSGVERV